jgi:Flp pilus assembly protein TadD
MGVGLFFQRVRTMRHLSSSASLSLLLLSSCVISVAPLAAQQGTPPPLSNPTTGTNAPVISYTVNGMVSDADNHTQLNQVKMELHAFGGAIVGTAFTSGNGNFQFLNVQQGRYTMVADQVGYQTASEEVEVMTGSVYGLLIELLKTPDTTTPAAREPATVSLRDLSIPHKARNNMEQGIVLLYQKSEYRRSLKKFEKAIREYPGYYEAYMQMGVAYSRLADTANSEQAFRKSMELSDDKYPDAYVGLAELFLERQRLADAEVVARRAVEIDGDSWLANVELARVLVELRRASEAEINAIAAVKLRPEIPILYLVLANCHIQLRNDRALFDDINHYLQLAPDGVYAEQARLQRDELQAAPGATQIARPTLSPAQP